MGQSPSPASTTDSVTQLTSSLSEWTRDEIASRILAGENLFIYRSRVIRVTPSWLKRHPGGELAILHFVGRDATDEVDAFHPDETLRVMQHYAVARIKDDPAGWEPLVPPYMAGWIWTDGKWTRVADTTNTTPAGLRAEASGYLHDEMSPSSQILLVEKGTFKEQMRIEKPSLETISPPPPILSRKVQLQHSEAYKKLHQRLIDVGLYKTRFITGIGPDVLRYILFASLAVWFYKKNMFLLSAFCLGIFWHQATFFVHDAGHMGVTHNWTIDRLLSILVADFIGGLSVGWWVHNHNTHHLVTNHPNHDPDIEYLPFFAITPHFMSNLYSTYYKRVFPFDMASRILLRVQHKMFYVIMALARFNLYRLSYTYLFNSRRDTIKARGGRWSWWGEIVGIVVYWIWYGAVLWGTGSWVNALQYLLVSHVTTSPLHVQIVLSHFSRSSADMGPVESFAARQMRTSIDVICPEYLGFIHGGLHLQVTHHLFPRLPRHNLKAASKLVKEFAHEQGLEYAEFGFIEGNAEVCGVLRNVAQQVRVMSTVIDANIKEAVDISRKVSPSKD